MADETLPATVQRLADLAFATARRVLADDQDAHDCAQEALAQWWGQRDSIRLSAFGWVMKAAHARAVDLVRRHSTERRAVTSRPPSADPRPPAEPGELRRLIDDGLAALGETDRALLLEHHLVGTTQQELARRCRCSQPTIHRRLGRAAALLGAFLRRHGVEVPAASLPVLLAQCADATAPTTVLGTIPASAHPTALSLGWWAAQNLLGRILLVAAGLAVTAGAGLVLWRSQIDRQASIQTALVRELAGAALRRLGYQGDLGQDRRWSITALVATLPPVDEVVQRRWREWEQEQLSTETVGAGLGRQRRLVHVQDWAIENLVWTGLGEGCDDSVWLDDPSSVCPPQAQQALTDAQARLAPIRDLLDNPRLLLNASGWLAQEHRRGNTLRPAGYAEVPDPTLLLTRNIAMALSLECLFDADRSNALRQLDGLVAATQRGKGSLVDAMIGVALAAIRDDTYLRLLRRNALPPAALTAWLAETPPHLARCSDGLVYDALVHQIPFCEDWLDGHMPLAPSVSRVQQPIMTAYAPWVRRDFSEANCETLLFAAALVSNGPVDRQRFDAYLASISQRFVGVRICMPHLLESAQTALEADSRHVMLRTCARFHHDRLAGLPLPNDLPADTGGGLRYTLRYRRLTADRFEWYADPDAPPALAYPTRLRESTYRAPSARPRRDTGIHSARRLHLEMTLPPPPGSPTGQG